MGIVTIWLLLGLGDTGECSIRQTFTGPTETLGIVLARSTGTRVAVPVPAGGPYPAFGEGATAEAHGFEVVQRTGGAGLPIRGQKLLAVPWAYAENCARRPWTDDQWVPEGALAVFYVDVEAVREVDGIVVTDQLGWHAPYPHAEAVGALRRPRPPEDRSEWLSANEAFDFLSGLPVSRPGESESVFLERLEAYYQQLPTGWAERFPADGILWEARFRVGRRNRPAA